jgi:hypothetical protein
VHNLIPVDQNHPADAALLNVASAQGAVASTLTACGVSTISAAAVNCPLLGRPATIADFAGHGLDSPGDLGVSNCSPADTGIGAPCAFGGINPGVGAVSMAESGGRSVYNAFDIKVTQNVRHPFSGVK